MSRLSHCPALVGHTLMAAAESLRPAPAVRRGERGDAPRRILYLSQVIWHHVWGRPQEIAERLTRHAPVTFIGPTPVNRMLEVGADFLREQTRCDGRLSVHSPPMIPGEYRSALIRRLNASHTERLIRRLGVVPEETALLTNNPFLPEIAERFRWGLLIYDWMDDFACFPWAPRGGRALERRMTSRADLFTAGTQFLADRKRETCGEIHFLQNGVRYEQFARCTDPRPNDLPTGFEHIAGFIGTLGAQFDTELIEAAARAMPRVAFALIGPQHGSLGSPPRGENIFLLGPKPHASLPPYVRHFSAGLIPVRTGPGSEAINPTKLLEYAAASVPVVSTALHDVQRLFGDCVAAATNSDEFITALRRAIEGGMREEVERARARAEATSWDAMVGQLWGLIQGAWEAKR